MERDSITILGRDVLVNIFSLLPFRTLLNLMSVCSKFRLYLQDEKVWKKKCLEDFQLDVRRDDHLSWKDQYYFFKKVKVLIIGPGEYLGDVTAQLVKTKKLMKNQIKAMRITEFTSFFQLTIDHIKEYNAVMIFRNVDGQYFGDTLADYVDCGGGVVVSLFCNATLYRLGGRWDDKNYYPIMLAPQYYDQHYGTIGKIHLPSHPLLRDVKEFNGGRESFYAKGRVHPDAQLVAEWSFGDPLIAAFVHKKIVGLNMYPPSTGCREDLWDSSTDGGHVLANSILYVCGNFDWNKYTEMKKARTALRQNLNEKTEL